MDERADDCSQASPPLAVQRELPLLSGRRRITILSSQSLASMLSAVDAQVVMHVLQHALAVVAFPLLIRVIWIAGVEFEHAPCVSVC